MKHPLLLGIAALVLPFLSASAAVGTLLVQNNNGGTVVPIYDVDGTTKIFGPNFSIGIYVVNPDGSVISQLGGFTTAATSNGRFTLGQLDVGIAGGTVNLSLHVWDLRTGATYETALRKGYSAAFVSPVLGGDDDNDPNTPNRVTPIMVQNLQSILLIGSPEPSTLALAALGLGGLILVNRRKLPGISNDLDSESGV